MAESPLVIKNLTFQYRTRPEKAVEDVSIELKPGEMLLIAGSSGCGKTTLARCINGLIPRSYRGTREGKVLLHGKDVAELQIAEVAQTVGTLLQDPERQIVASNVFNEIAFGPENLGLPRDEILQRVEQAMKRLKIEYLRARETFHLSGGEKQKVALAGLLAMNPSILLLDEPLASLDPASAYEALEVFRGLADEGKTVVLIEHRVEDAIFAKPDRLLYMEAGQVKYLGSIDSLPTVINHKEVKLPAEWVVKRVRQIGEMPKKTGPAKREASDALIESKRGGSRYAEIATRQSPLVVFENVDFRYSEEAPFILQGVNLNIQHGDLIAVLGPNGAGKSTLVKHAIGLLKPTNGRVLVEGNDTKNMSVAQIAHTLGFVFQSPTHMLYAPTVREELEFGPKNLDFEEVEIKKLVAASVSTVNLKNFEEYPPLGLSFGQQKRTTIAAVLAMQSKIMIMDEPTAGQDYSNYTHFMDAMCRPVNGSKSLVAANFAATLFITHDLDLAVTYANRILLFGDKHIVADGRPEDVLKDFDLLTKYRVRPTSLLRMNVDLLPSTGQFLTAEALAAYD